MDEEKMSKLKESDVPTIEIDLSNFYYIHNEKCQVDKQFIDENLDDLLTDIKLKKWVNPPSLIRKEWDWKYEN